MNHFERANEVLREVGRDPIGQLEVNAIAAALLDFGDDGRKHGERWAEIAIASYIKSLAFQSSVEPATRETLLQLAREVEDRTWRRPEFQSGHDLADAAKAAGLIPYSVVPPRPSPK